MLIQAVLLHKLIKATHISIFFLYQEGNVEEINSNTNN